MSSINMDFEGLLEIISRLIVREEIDVDIEGFENDFATFRSKDDVLTLLIHLGYLAWNGEERTVRIPNEEIQTECRKKLKDRSLNQGWFKLLSQSRKLLEDSIGGKTTEVAKAIDAIRQT